MIKSKKSLGQNFLIDNNIVNKIIKLSDVCNNNIVEIGPGTGNLTKKIIEQNPKSLILIEKDHKLTSYLNTKLSDSKNIKIFNEDILKFELESKIKKESTIIGNLPYNISSQILAKLIKFKKWLPKYKKLILMFQKEVADKILAKHSSSLFGRLAILTNARLMITDHFNVSPNCFYPVPKVKSTILVFEPIINQDFKVKDISNLEKITHIFFSRKRKMINKAFKKVFKKPTEVADKILAKHNTSSFGRLTILTNARLKITNHFNISQNCFYPVPKVKSTILVFEPIINQDFKIKNIANLEKISHVFFSKKRKMVNKAFKELFKKPIEIARKINVNLSLRPNQLSEKEYYKITEYFEKKL